MDFLIPAEIPPIKTYHVMDSGGSVEDSSRRPPDTTDDQVIEWYKNMLTGKFENILINGKVQSFLTGRNKSQYYGQHYVRSSKTWSSQFLHGEYSSPLVHF